MHFRRSLLIQALETLSSSADDQVRHLKALFRDATKVDNDDFGVDELALELDDAIGERDRGGTPGVLSATEAAAVFALCDYLTSVSGEEHARLWTIRALREDSEWERIRQLARNALLVLER